MNFIEVNNPFQEKLVIVYMLIIQKIIKINTFKLLIHKELIIKENKLKVKLELYKKIKDIYKFDLVFLCHLNSVIIIF